MQKYHIEAQMGFEPTTNRLTAERSTIELLSQLNLHFSQDRDVAVKSGISHYSIRINISKSIKCGPIQNRTGDLTLQKLCDSHLHHKPI